MSIEAPVCTAANICKVCGKSVPPNEWVSYRQHEDCWVSRCPPTERLVIPLHTGRKMRKRT